jgi:hypothetical protein
MKWRVAADILNKQSRTADSGWSNWGWAGLTTPPPHRKTRFCYETLHAVSEQGRFFGGKARRKETTRKVKAQVG